MGSFYALSPLRVKFGGLDLEKGQLVCMYCYFLNAPCGSYCKVIKNVVHNFGTGSSHCVGHTNALQD